ncbi:caspase family protein [Aquibium microcysteis]|uniref:caspase family protein n=1 Tax=Aquibium microcysteis TaxID=675281 RepID=UPI00165CF550|nr:caspase family protein [Aquibium microcysteis]
MTPRRRGPFRPLMPYDIGAALRLLFPLLALLAFPGQAAAAEPETLRGVALVIGNGAYRALPRLANPMRDADAIEALLADLGFDSIRRTDRDGRSMRRDLERFAEDVEGADVAVLYYAGHGIEAGGENFLVPIDADLAALDAADERLVPLSEVLERLRRSVAVTILLLDACRDNPFPPGAVLRKTPGSQAQPVSAGGLSETRGARAIGDRDAPADNLGMVIGFAAEPGRPALDGVEGGHSPYAEALLRHIDAMGGEEFGTVMRMVAEEVYLRTGGRQRPWVNESLRRLLYLGAPAPEREAAEAAVLGERRRLLVTIADLPDPQRARAENLAHTGNVPMSLVYAMLQAAGVDPADDPDRVEARLKTEIERFATLSRDRRALDDPDPEIRRLSALADAAELEGALNAASAFRDQAKARVAGLRETRQEQLRALRARILEDAEVFVRSAETRKLLFRFDDAARDFGEARQIAGEVDTARAGRLLEEEIGAWLVHAEIAGAPGSLRKAEELARAALTGGGLRSSGGLASLRHKLGLVLMLKAEREGDAAPLAEAVALLDQAAADDAGREPSIAARVALDLGRARGEAALRANRVGDLGAAKAAFERAGALASQAGDAALEAEARFRMVQALYFMWAAAPDPALMAELVGHLAAMIATLDRAETDVLAARYVVRSVAIAFDAAQRQNTTGALSAAGEIAEMAAGIFDPDRFPLIGAEIGSLRARIALEWAERFGDASALPAARDMQRAALDVFRLAGYAAAARDAEWHLALTLIAIGRRSADEAALDEAATVLDRLAADPHVAGTPELALQVAFEQARTKAIAARMARDASALSEAAAAFRALQSQLPPEHPQGQRIRLELGRSLAAAGEAARDAALLREGTGLLADAVQAWEAWGSDDANPGPFLDVYGDYAGSAAALAVEAGGTDDIETAIEAQARLLGLYEASGHAAGAAVASNGLAYVLMLSARQTQDQDRLERAEKLVDAARAGIALWPDFEGYVENTACEIDTERARRTGDRSLARAALDRCRAALALLSRSGQDAAIPVAEASAARAGALVLDLDR